MRSLFAQLLRDDRGFVVSAELILVATVVVLGLIAGLATLRNQLVQELGDSAMATSQLNQGYSYSTDINGEGNSTTLTYGDVVIEISIGDSTYTDLADVGDFSPGNENTQDGSGRANDVGGQPPAGIVINNVTPAATNEQGM